MTDINGNYSNSDALLKKLQMKGLMEEKKEETETTPAQEGEEETTLDPAYSENNEGSLQSLDYQAVLNSSFISKNKIKTEANAGEFKTYNLSGNGKSSGKLTKLKVNNKTVWVKGTGTFDIAVDGNNIIIKATSTSSSITFSTNQDLNYIVEKSDKAPNKKFNLTTGSGNDNVIIKEGAVVGGDHVYRQRKAL